MNTDNYNSCTLLYMETYVCLQYVKSTVKMDVCLRDNLILFRSKVNLQLPIVILKRSII